jgi:hypothetical protein
MAAGWLMSLPAAAGDFGGGAIDILSVTTSSVDGRERYAPENAVDGRTDTAWVVPNRGPGEWLEVRFRDTTRIAEIGVVVGYDKVRADVYGDRWDKNNRVRKLAIEWDGGERHVVLRDDRAMQWVKIGAVDVDRIRLRVVDVRRGSRWNDTAIAEVTFRPPTTPVEKKAGGRSEGRGEGHGEGHGEGARASAGDVAAERPAPTAASQRTSELGRSELGAPELGAPELGRSELGAPELGGPQRGEASSLPTLRSVTVWVACLGVLGLVVVGGLRRRLRRGSSPRDDALVARAREALRSIKRDARNLGDQYAPVLAACVDLSRSAEHTGDQCAATRLALSRTRGLSSAGALARRERLEEREARARGRLARIVDQLEDVAALLATLPRDRLDQHDVEAMIQRLSEEVRFVDAAEEELQCNES